MADKKISELTPGVPSDSDLYAVARDDSNLKVPWTAIKAQFDAAGSSSGVQTNLTTHINRTNIHFTDAPNDGTQYGRQSGGWTPVVGGGVTDHGALTGLDDDDHLQYHTDARGDARYDALGAAGAVQSNLTDHIGSGGAEHATFMVGLDGFTPAPLQADVDSSHVLQADGAWVAQTGGAGGGGDILSETPPPTPTEGQGWVDTSTFIRYVWYDDGSSQQWVQTDPGISGGGAAGGGYDTIEDDGIPIAQRTTMSFNGGMQALDDGLGTTLVRINAGDGIDVGADDVAVDSSVQRAIATPTDNNLVSTDQNGLVQDSGVAAADVGLLKQVTDGVTTSTDRAVLEFVGSGDATVAVTDDGTKSIVTINASAGAGGGGVQAGTPFTQGQLVAVETTVGDGTIESVGIIAADVQVRIPTPTLDNLVAMDGAGIIKDSGVAASDFALGSATVTAGAGLTGGGAVSTNPTLDIVAAGGGGITVTADAIAVDATVQRQIAGGTDGNLVSRDASGDVQDAGVASAAVVTKIGTPVDNQIAVWTGDGTVEGTTGLEYADRAKLSVEGAAIISTLKNAEPGGEQVYANSDGQLFTVVPPDPGWSSSDTDTGIYAASTGSTTQPWVEITGLVLTVGGDIVPGDRIDFSYRVQISASSHTGVMDIGFGLGVGVAPVGLNFDAHIIPADYAGSISGHQTSDTQTLTNGQSISIWYRVQSGTNPAFSVTANGATSAHEAFLASPAAGGDSGGTVREPHTWAVQGAVADAILPGMFAVKAAGETLSALRIVAQTTAGTCDVSIEREGTPIIGASLSAVGISKQSTTFGPEVLADEDSLTCIVTLSSGAENLSVTLELERAF